MRWPVDTFITVLVVIVLILLIFWLTGHRVTVN